MSELTLYAQIWVYSALGFGCFIGSFGGACVMALIHNKDYLDKEDSDLKLIEAERTIRRLTNQLNMKVKNDFEGECG